MGGQSGGLHPGAAARGPCGTNATSRPHGSQMLPWPTLQALYYLLPGWIPSLGLTLLSVTDSISSHTQNWDPLVSISLLLEGGPGSSRWTQLPSTMIPPGE